MQVHIAILLALVTAGKQQKKKTDYDVNGFVSNISNHFTALKSNSNLIRSFLYILVQKK